MMTHHSCLAVWNCIDIKICSQQKNEIFHVTNSFENQNLKMSPEILYWSTFKASIKLSFVFQRKIFQFKWFNSSFIASRRQIASWLPCTQPHCQDLNTTMQWQNHASQQITINSCIYHSNTKSNRNLRKYLLPCVPNMSEYGRQCFWQFHEHCSTTTTWNVLLVMPPSCCAPFGTTHVWHWFPTATHSASLQRSEHCHAMARSYKSNR